MGPSQVTAGIAVATLVTVVIGVVVVLRARRNRRDAAQRAAADEQLRRQVLERFTRQVAEWDDEATVGPLGGMAPVGSADDLPPTTPDRATPVTRQDAAHHHPRPRRGPRVAGALVLVLGLVVIAAASVSWLTSH